MRRIGFFASYLIGLIAMLAVTGCAPVSEASLRIEEEPAAVRTIPTLTALPVLEEAEVAPVEVAPTLAPSPTEAPPETPTRTPTPLPTETPEPTNTPTPNPDAELLYEVQSGDTPGEIAAQYGVDVDEMLAYNEIADPTLLQVGSTLRIPVGEARVEAMRATATARALVSPTVAVPVPPPATSVPVAVVPTRVTLEISHTYQRLNNCAPSATSMALSYFGLVKSQYDMAALQKPNASDVNVTAEEVGASIRELGMGAFVGINGDVDMVIRLVAAGFPVMTEEWMPYDSGVGHFRVIRGYDTSRQQIIYNDSYYGPNLARSYDAFLRDWKPFNNKYIVPYHPDQEAQVRALIGVNADPATMFESLRATSQAQVDANPGDAYGWWGLGEALLWQGNPRDASYAFEQALATGNLPWRYLWYRYGYFEALNELGRYEDLLRVTEKPLSQMTRSEDIRYHRAVALQALGRVDEAKTELRRALEDNPRFVPAATLLAQLGG